MYLAYAKLMFMYYPLRFRWVNHSVWFRQNLIQRRSSTLSVWFMLPAACQIEFAQLILICKIIPWWIGPDPLILALCALQIPSIYAFIFGNVYFPRLSFDLQKQSVQFSFAQPFHQTIFRHADLPGKLLISLHLTLPCLWKTVHLSVWSLEWYLAYAH